MIKFSHSDFPFLSFLKVRKFQEEVLANETKHHLLQLKNRNLELLLQRAQEEIKLYVSSKTEDKKKSLREQLLKQVFFRHNRPASKIVLSFFSLQIADQEKRSKVLKEEQKKVKDSLSVASKQVSTTAVVLVQKHVFLASSSRSMVFLQLPYYLSFSILFSR